MAAALSIKFPHWGAGLGRALSRAYRTPVALFGTVVAISALAYIPMALVFSPISWTTFGPFTFQTSRLFHYAAYFLIAVGLGAFGLDRELFAHDGKLAKHACLHYNGASDSLTLRETACSQ